MIKLGNNILSQTVQRNLGRATQDLSKASERLSSGQRINRASDDAAGLAISMSLDKDRILARTAQRNVSDGISMVSIMASGLKSQKEILFRMAELAEQSANGTYSSQQREVLQKEYSSLMDEFDRVADATEFNGVKLLRNSTPQTIQFMAGITGADTSLLQVAAANSHRFAGVLAQRVDWNNDNMVGGNDSVLFRFYVNQEPFNGSQDLVQDVAIFDIVDSQGKKGKVRLALDATGDTAGMLLWTDGNIYLAPSSRTNNRLKAYAIREDGDSYVTNSSDIPVGQKSLSLQVTYATSGATASVNIDLSDIQYQLLDWKPDGSDLPVRQTVIGFTNVESASASRRALSTITNRMDDLSSLEGQYGAIESRLQVAHNLLGSAGENFAAAASRIKDADIASEAANSVRSGILQQAASSLLAQANQAPQIALSLLRG